MPQLHLLSQSHPHTGDIAALAPHSRGGVWYSLGRNGEIFSHNESGSEPGRIRSRDSHVNPHGYDNDFDISPDGAVLCIAHSDRYLPGVRFHSPHAVYGLDLSRGCGENTILAARYHPSGYAVAFVTQWPREPGSTVCLSSVIDKRQWRTFSVKTVCESIEFSPDGRLMVVTGGDIDRNDTALELRDMRQNRVARIAESQGGSRIMQFTPMGRWVIFGLQKRLCSYDCATGRSMSVDAGAEITCLSITADSLWCITGHRDNHLRLWSLGEGFNLAATVDCSAAVLAVSGVSASGRFICALPEGIIGLCEIEGFVPRQAWTTAGKITGFLTWYEGFEKELYRLPPHCELTERDDIAGVCGWCGAMIGVPETVRCAIEENRLKWKRFPALELPIDAWTDHRLGSTCSECGSAVQFNPFDIQPPEIPVFEALKTRDIHTRNPDTESASSASGPEKQFPRPYPRRLCGMPLLIDGPALDDYEEELRIWKAEKKAWDEQHNSLDR